MNTAESAIQKLRRLHMLPKGTRVLANNWFEGVIDGITTDGKYVVLFDYGVVLPGADFQVSRVAVSKEVVRPI